MNLADELDRLKKENDAMRHVIAASGLGCIYCGLSANKIAECRHGFPGCSRADDLLNDGGVLQFVIPKFIEAMDDIGRYGEEKYGADSFRARAKLGIKTRYLSRIQASVILQHVEDHTVAYQMGAKHDHFQTMGHQLAAAAFNLMMEFYFAGLEGEGEIPAKTDARESGPEAGH